MAGPLSARVPAEIGQAATTLLAVIDAGARMESIINYVLQNHTVRWALIFCVALSID